MINSVDKFVFYDDVNYINRGWINRNRILVNGQAHTFTISLKEASQNKLIKDIDIVDNRKTVLKTIEQAYKKAPLFNSAFEIVKNIMEYKTDKISDLAIYSVVQVSKYFGISTIFEKSSECYSQTKGQEKATRLQNICNLNNAKTYINAIGGQELYSKDNFKQANVDLFFIKTLPIEYKQYKNDFVPWLSIIDVMMFNSQEQIKYFLNRYELI